MTMFSTGSLEWTQMRKVSRNLKIGKNEPQRGQSWGTKMNENQNQTTRNHQNRALE